MKMTDRPLSDVKNGMNKYPQQLLNIKLEAGIDLSRYPEIDEVVRDAEDQLGHRGRVLLRPSGTEPLLRVMVEGEDENQVTTLARALAERVENVLLKHA